MEERPVIQEMQIKTQKPKLYLPVLQCYLIWIIGNALCIACVCKAGSYVVFWGKSLCPLSSSIRIYIKNRENVRILHHISRTREYTNSNALLYNKFYIDNIGRWCMSEPAVLDWDRIVHKNVRSSDGQDAGNVDAIDGDSIVIITEGARKEYKISKSQVDGYNGAEVFLKLTIGELEKYRV
jgi:hypothetical protein